MSLANEYKQQYRWRRWSPVMDALPPLDRSTILDLGCGVGDVAAELAARGARVVGIDANEALIHEARSRRLPGAEFRLGDLHQELDTDLEADGLWCSFTAAYFPDLAPAIRRWSSHLQPGGWMVLTEVDDLFAHDPLEARTKELLDAYADDALAAGRYDFRMGRRLHGQLQDAGFVVSKVLMLSDQELSFSGPASPDVLEAWRRRFARMTLLSRFCGTRMRQVEEDFIGCLSRKDHRSIAKVYCCIAARDTEGAPT